MKLNIKLIAISIPITIVIAIVTVFSIRIYVTSFNQTNITVEAADSAREQGDQAMKIGDMASAKIFYQTASDAYKKLGDTNSAIDLDTQIKLIPN